MKVFVDGQEVDLDRTNVQIDHLTDFLIVKSPNGAASALAIRSGDATLVSFRGQQYKVETRKPRAGAHGTAANGEIRAPMPGQIVDVLVTAGSAVRKGDKVLVLEAMKTQQAFVAPFDGQVAKLEVVRGDQVSDGDLLALIGANEGEHEHTT